MSRPLLITLFFTAFIAATYGFGVYLFPAIMPNMIGDLQLHYSDAGTIIAIAQIGFLLSALMVGFISARLDPLLLIYTSVLFCAICLFLIPFASGFPTLTILFFVLGACSASVWVPMVIVVKSRISESHQGKSLGLMSSGTAYGLLLNGFSIPMLMPLYGWKSVWFFVSCLTVLILISAVFYIGLKSRIGENPISSSEVEIRKPTSWTSFLQIRYLLIPLMMFLSGISCMPSQNYLSALIQDQLKYEISISSNLWKIIGLTGMFGGFAMGTLADIINIRRTLILNYLLLTISIAGFLLHPSIFYLYASAAIFGLAFNANFGLIPAYVNLRYSVSETGPIFGLGNVMLGIGAMIGNFVGGILKDVSNSFDLTYEMTLCSAIALFFIALLFVSKKRKDETEPNKQ